MRGLFHSRILLGDSFKRFNDSRITFRILWRDTFEGFNHSRIHMKDSLDRFNDSRILMKDSSILGFFGRIL